MAYAFGSDGSRPTAAPAVAGDDDDAESRITEPSTPHPEVARAALEEAHSGPAAAPALEWGAGDPSGESTDRDAVVEVGPERGGEPDPDNDLTQVEEADHNVAALAAAEASEPAEQVPAAVEAPARARAPSTVDFPLLEEDEDEGGGPPEPESVDIPIDMDAEERSGQVMAVPEVAGAAGERSGAAGKRSGAAPRRAIPRAQTMALSDADLEELADDEGLAEPVVSSADRSILDAPSGTSDGAILSPIRDAGDSGEIIADDMLEEIDESGRAAGHAPDVRFDEGPGADAGAEMPIDQTLDLPDEDDDIEEVPAEDVDPATPEPERLPRPQVSVQSAPASAGQPPVPKQKPPPAPAPSAARAAAAAAAAAAADPSQNRNRRRRGKPWFEEIFDEDYLRTLPFLTPQATQMEAHFVMDALGVGPGSQVLDIGCGYGRHAMELAARGYHVVGLDSSLPLLLRGADEAQRRGLTINFVHGDVRDMSFDAQFDGAYCLFSTFGYFDDETNKKAAANICRALKPGARCVFEVLNRDYIIADLPMRVWWEGDGCVVLEEVDFNYFSSRIQSNRSVVFDDGRQLEQEISIRSFGLHELGKLLHAVGYRVVEVSGSMTTRGRFFGAHSRDIVVVAERRVEKAGAGVGESGGGGRTP